VDPGVEPGSVQPWFAGEPYGGTSCGATQVNSRLWNSLTINASKPYATGLM